MKNRAFNEVGVYTCGKCHILFRVIDKFPEDEPISTCWDCPRRFFDGVRKNGPAAVFTEDAGDEAVGRYAK